MDRREVSGLIALSLLLAGSSATAQAPRPSPDPSAMGPVGLTPLRSIDQINGIPSMPGTTPASAVSPAGLLPMDPTASGPRATVPNAPIGPDPVGMSPLPSIRTSINTTEPRSIIPRLGVSSWFRKDRTAVGKTSRAQSAPGFAQPLPRLDPAAVPSAFPAPMPGDPDPAASPAAPLGRPSPYADQVPQGARRQAERPGEEAPSGRLAPLSTEVPRAPRPRPAATRGTQNFRPPTSADPSPPVAAPRPASDGVEPPPPVIVPPPPPRLEPSAPPAADAPPVLGEPLALAVPTATPTIVDPEVKQTSAEATSVRIKDIETKDLPVATRRAASVGDEVITFREVMEAVNERYHQVAEGGEMSKDQIAALADEVLNQMIDQTLILQEVYRLSEKNPKALVQFNDFIDKKWKEDELPPLLRSTATANEYELKKKFTEMGKSYSAMKDAYRKSMLANDYLMSKVRAKVSADLVEQKAWYNQHLNAYNQPARMNWREIEINFGANQPAPAKYADRAAALKQAEATLARLTRGEDFDAVARSLSDGPTASKGGLYADMTPGGYGIPSVNDELNRLPVGKLSGIIEAPAAFHIIRVESRRDAGPLRFDEVQEKIRDEVFRRNLMKARAEYLAKLRSRTLIRTMFDRTDSTARAASR